MVILELDDHDMFKVFLLETPKKESNCHQEFKDCLVKRVKNYESQTIDKNWNIFGQKWRFGPEGWQDEDDMSNIEIELSAIGFTFSFKVKRIAWYVQISKRGK